MPANDWSANPAPPSPSVTDFLKITWVRLGGGRSIPNLERFPGMGRLFFERPTRSVEARNGMDGLHARLKAIAKDGEIREYVMSHDLLLYARFDATIYLLSIRHHRQLSFDFQSLWAAKP